MQDGEAKLFPSQLGHNAMVAIGAAVFVLAISTYGLFSGGINQASFWLQASAGIALGVLLYWAFGSISYSFKIDSEALCYREEKSFGKRTWEGIEISGISKASIKKIRRTIFLSIEGKGISKDFPLNGLRQPDLFIAILRQNLGDRFVDKQGLLSDLSNLLSS